MSWSFRHLEEPALDPTTSPWPSVKGAVLAFLRHRLSAYDDRLRGEYNQELRDELATEVAQAALRRYPWLGKDDPRPFPEQEKGSPTPVFTTIARDLAHYHSVRDHLTSAIRDLKREGRHLQVKALQNNLASLETRIARCYGILAGPKHTREGDRGQSRGFAVPHLPQEMGHYWFLDDRVATPNRYHFLGFRCQECNAPVVQLKQPVDFGQGWKMLVASCYCHTLAVACPPAGRRLKPVTAKQWDFTKESDQSP